MHKGGANVEEKEFLDDGGVVDSEGVCDAGAAVVAAEVEGCVAHVRHGRYHVGGHGAFGVLGVVGGVGGGRRRFGGLAVAAEVEGDDGVGVGKGGRDAVIDVFGFWGWVSAAPHFWAWTLDGRDVDGAGCLVVA